MQNSGRGSLLFEKRRHGRSYHFRSVLLLIQTVRWSRLKRNGTTYKCKVRQIFLMLVEAWTWQGRVFSFLNSLSEHEKQTHGNKQYCLKLLPLSLGMDERFNMIWSCICRVVPLSSPHPHAQPSEIINCRLVIKKYIGIKLKLTLIHFSYLFNIHVLSELG